MNILIFAPLFSVDAVATGDATPINCQIFSVADGAVSAAKPMCAQPVISSAHLGANIKKRRTQQQKRKK